MRAVRRLDDLQQDLRYGLRQLARNPRFTTVVVITLALGIGANTAIFSVANAVLFRGLPFGEPERLVQIWNNFHGHGLQNVVFSQLEYLDYRSRIRQPPAGKPEPQVPRNFDDLAVYGQKNQTLKASGVPETIWVSSVSANLFDLLGVRPLLGRTFLPDENGPGRTGVAVLSHSLWQRRFSGDPAVVGESIMVDGESLTVVGVMPASFRFAPTLAEIWRPLALDGAVFDESDRGSRSLWMVGRLQPAASLEEARREMQAHARQIASEHREQYPELLGHAITVVPLHEQVTGRVRRALLILLGAVGMVLLIACANVANLLLTRANDRNREMAVRAALGASRLRILSQMFTESVLLALLGGAAGTLLATWSVHFLLQWLPSGVLPRMEEVVVSPTVLGFSLGLSLLTGVLFALAPALHASAADLMETLKDGARTTVDGSRTALRRLLTISEVALAVVLLVAAGLLLRSFARLLSVPPGFDAGNALTMQIALPGSKYLTRAQQFSFFEELTTRTHGLPGVDAVALVTSLPFSGWRNDGASAFTVCRAWMGRRASRCRRQTTSLSTTSTSGRWAFHFCSRGFTASDASSAPVVIVNQTLAQRFWPGQDPLGKRLKMGSGSSPWPWRTIVGVVGDVRQTNLETAIMPEIFVLNEDERKPPVQSMFLVVRASTEPTQLAAAIRREVASLDPDQAVTNIRSLAERVSLSVSERRFHVLLLAIFAGVALSLAAVGVYAVIAFSVGQRTREIGLRMALGAQKHDIFRLVVGEGMGLAAIGVGLGAAAAGVLVRFLESLLFEIGAGDPLTFASVVLVLGVVAFLACWLPARRAAGIDPMVALRHQ